MPKKRKGPSDEAEEPTDSNSLQWLGGWPGDPDAPMPGLSDFRRMHLMEAAKMYLESMGILETMVSEEVVPGVFLDVSITVRKPKKDAAG